MLGRYIELENRESFSSILTLVMNNNSSAEFHAFTQK